MHEKRNFIMILLLIASIIWSLIAWLLFQSDHVMVLPQRIASLLLVITLSTWLIYAMKYEDKLPDHLRNVVGEFYFEADGLSFMPIIRVKQGGAEKGQAELCVYYQNRFENHVEAIVHLRPPPPEESFIIMPGMRDVHFAFRCGGGDFGVIHQPIAVPRFLQGEVIDVKMAASAWFPRSQGARLRTKPGISCGTLLVDWVGNPLKIGVHEVSGEVPLNNPVTLHLAMPERVSEDLPDAQVWRQEQLAAGVST